MEATKNGHEEKARRGRKPGPLLAVGWSAYVLHEPNCGPVRYVGTTSMPLDRRLSLHVSAATTTPDRQADKAAWIRSVIPYYGPCIKLLESFDGRFAQGAADVAEAKWIGRYLIAGASLVNASNVARACAMYDLPHDRICKGGRVIYAALNDRNMTHTDLARICGVATRTVGFWIEGHSSPVGLAFDRLQSFLGSVDMDALFPVRWKVAS